MDKHLNGARTVILSIDDLYLTHQAQTELAERHPDNPLIQHRGQPSTHDLPLLLVVLSDLSQGKEVKIPSYDKSAHSGQGDRGPEDEWKTVNQSGQPRAQIVILEGWCVGFRALGLDDLRRKWSAAVEQKNTGAYQGRLAWNEFEHIEFVNQALQGYDQVTDRLNSLIHLDAQEPLFVYSWRLDQEIRLRKTKGSGMTDAQVKSFVDGYYPTYELYTEKLRAGAFPGQSGKQLRIILGQERQVVLEVRI